MKENSKDKLGRSRGSTLIGQKQSVHIPPVSFFRNAFLSGLLAILLSVSAQAHVEVVATLLIEEYDGEIYVKAILEKKHITHALSAGAECIPSEMMSKCGPEYLLNHLRIDIEDDSLQLEALSVEIEKESVVILFKSSQKLHEINRVTIHFDYVFEYNDHGIIRVIIGINDQPTTYTLKPERTEVYFNKQKNSKK